MLIYKLLGDEAQSEFARSWGISYGMNAATEWKDIAIEAVKGTIILIILERLFLTRNSAWLEVRHLLARRLALRAAAL
jgi:hypothetical protein